MNKENVLEITTIIISSSRVHPQLEHAPYILE